VASPQLPPYAKDGGGAALDHQRIPEPVLINQLIGPGKSFSVDHFKTKYRVKHEQASDSQPSAFNGARSRQYSAWRQEPSSSSRQYSVLQQEPSSYSRQYSALQQEPSRLSGTVL